MTYDGGGKEEEVVPELRLKMSDGNGDYVKLRDIEDGEFDDPSCSSSAAGKGRNWWWWIKMIVLFVCLVVLAGVFLKWVSPYFMDKEIIPIINWETTTFTTTQLAVMMFVSIALFPSLLLPSSPSMWVAGMTFGYGFGFLLIIAGVTVGVSLPYVIGSLFYHKIQGLLEKYPKKASIIRLTGDCNWFGQFRAIALIRISPFPYIIYNYCAVATNVQYCPYLLGSVVGIIPEVFVAIYTGILIQTLADVSHERRTLTASQLIFNICGFSATVATTIIFTLYAKRKLRE